MKSTLFWYSALISYKYEKVITLRRFSHITSLCSAFAEFLSHSFTFVTPLCAFVHRVNETNVELIIPQTDKPDTTTAMFVRKKMYLQNTSSTSTTTRVSPQSQITAHQLGWSHRRPSAQQQYKYFRCTAHFRTTSGMKRKAAIPSANQFEIF